MVIVNYPIINGILAIENGHVLDPGDLPLMTKFRGWNHRIATVGLDRIVYVWEIPYPAW